MNTLTEQEFRTTIALQDDYIAKLEADNDKLRRELGLRRLADDLRADISSDTYQQLPALLRRQAS
jgi:hypothetical protein